MVPKLSLPLSFSVLCESSSCQNGWLRLLPCEHSCSCTGSIGNGDEQVLVLTEGVSAAVIADLFGSNERESKENLAIRPVLSFIPHSHVFGGVECGSLFSVKSSSCLLLCSFGPPGRACWMPQDWLILSFPSLLYPSHHLHSFIWEIPARRRILRCRINWPVHGGLPVWKEKQSGDELSGRKVLIPQCPGSRRARPWQAPGCCVALLISLTSGLAAGMTSPDEDYQVVM